MPALYTELLVGELYVLVLDTASGGVDPVPGLGHGVLGVILYRQARGVGRTHGRRRPRRHPVRLGSGRSSPWVLVKSNSVACGFYMSVVGTVDCSNSTQ